MMKTSVRYLTIVTCAVVVMVTVGMYRLLDIASLRSNKEWKRSTGTTRESNVQDQYSDGGKADIIHDEFDASIKRLLDGYAKIYESWSGTGFAKLMSLPFADLVHKLRLVENLHARGLADFRDMNVRGNMSACRRFAKGITNKALYDPDDGAVRDVLHDMATMKIVVVEMMDRGTELKLLITFEDGCMAVLKPMRFGRDYETLPNHFYFDEFERHTSEIAAFHLDSF